jgi:hypothetical protein
MANFQFGTQDVIITPPIGTELVGYPEREHGSTGIHDHLHAKAFVLSAADRTIALAFLDVCGIDEDFTELVRDLVCNRSNLSPQDIYLSFTHTHSGHACLSSQSNLLDRMYSQGDPKIDAITARQTAGAILAAYQKKKPGKIGFGSGNLTSMCTNRRDPEGLIDDEVNVIAFQGENDSLEGVIINYGCHPTALHQDNYLISRDFPGFTCDAVSRLLGPEVIVAFAQGTAGDVSTRWVRRSTTFDEAKRLGLMLAGETIRILQNLEIVDDVVFVNQSKQIKLPTRELPSLAEAEEKLKKETTRLDELRKSQAPYGDIRTQYVTQLGAKVRLDLIQNRKEEHVLAEVGILSINNRKVVLLPGEPFSRTGLQIKEGLGPGTIVLGYINRSLAYLVPSEDERMGGYEAGASLIDPSGVDKLLKDVIHLAQET